MVLLAQGGRARNFRLMDSEHYQLRRRHTRPFLGVHGRDSGAFNGGVSCARFPWKCRKC